jgi:hypothetical protein
MKKKFCKIMAIILASSMMSMTVFAAEDATFSDTNTNENTTTPASENSGSDNSGSGSSDQGDQSTSDGSQSAGGQADPGTSTGDGTQETSGNAGQGSGGTVSPEGNQGSTTPEGSQGSTTPSGSEGSQGSTTPSGSEGGEGETTPGTTPAASEGDSTGNDGKAPSSETGSSENASPAGTSSSETGDESSEGERREPEIQSESWSNGAIEDVMGVRAVTDGQTVTISYKTKSTNEWEHTWQNYPLTITYPDGTTQQIIIDYNKGVHGDNWSDIPGFSVSETSDQADTLTLNISIPASYFASQDFTVSSQNYSTSVNGDVIEEVSTNDPDAVYEGIGLDGNFNDWNAVTKYDLKEPEGDHNVESVAWVIDSDRGYVYIYIKDDGNNSATWAGPNHNGKFEILTDLGNRMLIQLTQDGAVVAANGYDAVHQGSQWEIAIPISELPANTGGLSFGLYMEDSSLSGYGDTGEISSPVGITYDGNSDDWTYYPSTLIQYATPGTQEAVVDGEAKQYNDQSENIYGYCTTQMPAHLNERGGEYTQAVSILVNNDWSHALGMRLVTVDGSGNINWNPQKQGLADGSYEYYIFPLEAWGTSTNINELVPADVCYGKATINISDTKQEMEWYVNTVKLAERYGIDATDVKTVSTQYGRIGQQFVTCAGTSSGPWGGAAMCLLSAVVPFVIKKKFIF